MLTSYNCLCNFVCTLDKKLQKRYIIKKSQHLDKSVMTTQEGK